MTRGAMAEKAENVSVEMQKALAAIADCERALLAAMRVAKRDYAGNAYQLNRICGAVGLLRSEVAYEAMRWEGYAEARRPRRTS